MFNADSQLMEKWGPVLEHESAPVIQDKYKKAVTARLLENQEVALAEEAAQMGGNYISEAANVIGAGMSATAGKIKGFNPKIPILVFLYSHHNRSYKKRITSIIFKLYGETKS